MRISGKEMNAFTAYLRAEEKSPATIEKYRREAVRFSRWLAGREKKNKSTLRRQTYSCIVMAADNALERIDKELEGGNDLLMTLTAVRIILQRALDKAEEMYLSIDEEITRLRLQEGD